MVKLLATEQIKAWDAFTIRHEPVASIDLMERACHAFVLWFTGQFDGTMKTGVVCGTGNNGGDGLGIARILKEWGYPVKVWVVRGGKDTSEDFTVNLEKWVSMGEVVEITSPEEHLDFDNCDVLIDGIFGSGLSRPVQGVYEQVIKRLNKADAIRVAIDVPSGLMADVHSRGAVVKADYTATFQVPKLAFYLPENHPFVGEWTVLDIGLSKEFIGDIRTSFYQLQRRDIRRIRKTRSRFGHKGNYGRAVLVSGSYGKMGAAVLAARAALRSGLGLLTVHIPACGYDILQTAVPEAMVSIDEGVHAIAGVPDASTADVVGIGPGLGTSPETIRSVRLLLESHKRPMVLDADALNIISAGSGLLQLIPPLSILTPHPKEFERLAGPWSNDFEKLDLLRSFARDLNVIVVLKGAFSAIASPDGSIYFNPTGNPGMATGGSGDVLTGIVTGLLAQGYSALESAMLGVYLHGASGDVALADKGMEGLIASDLIDYLPRAFKRI